jgi:hypothetical protein
MVVDWIESFQQGAFSHSAKQAKVLADYPPSSAVNSSPPLGIRAKSNRFHLQRRSPMLHRYTVKALFAILFLLSLILGIHKIMAVVSLRKLRNQEGS